MPPLFVFRATTLVAAGPPVGRAVGPGGVLRRLAGLAIVAAALLAAASLSAAEPLPTGATHRGLIAAGAYQIFPENRLGNGVYLDGKLLFTLPGQMVIGVAQIAPRGRTIYLARTGDGKRTVGVHTLPGDTAPRLVEPVKGYQYVTAGFDGQGFKKFYRVTDAAVADLLPTSRTADGLTVGARGILFFHVGISAAPAAAPGTVGAPAAAGEAAAPAGAYGVRLHWLNPETGAVRHLGRTIYNSLPTLKLTWLDNGQFQYTLSDGKSETLNVSDFR